MNVKNFLETANESTTDQWLDTENCVNRLVNEWKEHGRLIVAYDFDGTVNGKDLGTKGVDCIKMIQLLQRCKSDGCILIVFTARKEKDYPEIANWLNEHEVPFDYINENVPDMQKDETSKIFYNIFFDDRTGMGQSYEIMQKVLDIHESQITTESFIISHEDMLYNDKKFDTKETNMMFVIGQSGSGKTTTALIFAEEMNKVEPIGLDHIIWNEKLTLEEWKNYSDLAYSFFTGPGKKYYNVSEETLENYPAWDGMKYPYKGTYEYCIINDFVHYAMEYAKKYPKTRYIIEGIWIFLLMKPEEFKDYCVIIKGTSYIKSYIRGFIRDWEKTSKKSGWNALKWNFRKFSWLIMDMRWEFYLNNFRRYFSDISKSK